MRTVMLFGDSNTHGTLPVPDLGKSARMVRSDRWTTSFEAALQGWEVIVEGLPGRTTVHDDPIEGAHRNGLTVLPALLESHLPDAVVVMLGTNDLKPRFSLSAFDVAAGLERLVRTIRAWKPQTSVMLVAPPAITESGCLAEMFRGGAAKSHRLGDQIAAAARRADTAFFDAAPYLTVSPIDGVHYTPDRMPAFGLALAQAFRHEFGE
ncbi:MAG: GDSL-type esterase/lipase family protein [Paracoccaceae bacterium]